MLKPFYSILLAAALSLAAAHAQDTETKTEQDEVRGISTVITVIGSKYEEPQQNVTQEVNVISEEELQSLATSSRNITELIQYQPGGAVTVLSRNDANWS